MNVIVFGVALVATAGAFAALGLELAREVRRGWRKFRVGREFREMERQLSGLPVHGRDRGSRLTDW